MRLGVTLPTFSSDAAGVIEAAVAAERAGVHGVFAFDHLWPLGQPERPSLSLYPVLGAVGAATSGVQVGSLVARVGLLPDDVVVASFEGLREIVGKRLIAGLGTGDDESADEHLRNGIPYLGRRARLESLAAVLERLGRSGIERWVGGGGAGTNEVARGAGAALNLWRGTPERIEAAGPPVTWGGPLPSSPELAAERLAALASAGAAWAVWAWPRSLALVVEAAGLAGVPLGERAARP